MAARTKAARRTAGKAGKAASQARQNPYVQRFVQNTYGGSLLHAICTDPSIIVVAEHGRLEPVTAFMKEHYDADVTWIPVYEGSFRAWRCAPGTGT